jgi:hypothetical protein
VLDGLREKLVVAAVRAVHGVGGSQSDDRAHSAAFLADARVRGAVHETRRGEIEH